MSRYAKNLATINRISERMDKETNLYKRMAYRMVIKRLIERMEG